MFDSIIAWIDSLFYTTRVTIKTTRWYTLVPENQDNEVMPLDIHFERDRFTIGDLEILIPKVVMNRPPLINPITQKADQSTFPQNRDRPIMVSCKQNGLSHVVVNGETVSRRNCAYKHQKRDIIKFHDVISQEIASGDAATVASSAIGDMTLDFIRINITDKDSTNVLEATCPDGTCIRISQDHCSQSLTSFGITTFVFSRALLLMLDHLGESVSEYDELDLAISILAMMIVYND